MAPTGLASKSLEMPLGGLVSLIVLLQSAVLTVVFLRKSRLSVWKQGIGGRLEDQAWNRGTDQAVLEG